MQCFAVLVGGKVTEMEKPALVSASYLPDVSVSFIEGRKAFPCHLGKCPSPGCLHAIVKINTVHFKKQIVREFL
jgi:hypothetical protein